MTDELEDEENSCWYAYEGGQTIGDAGFSGGKIFRDEEYGIPGSEQYFSDDENAPAGPDARITVEHLPDDTAQVTVTIYGWLYESVRFADPEAALNAFEAIRLETTALADAIPYEDDPQMSRKAAELPGKLNDFAQRLKGWGV